MSGRRRDPWSWLAAAVVAAIVGPFVWAIATIPTFDERADELRANGWTIVSQQPVLLAKKCDGSSLIRLRLADTSYREERIEDADECEGERT